VTTENMKNRGLTARVAVIATFGGILCYAVLSLIDLHDTRPRLMLVLYLVVIFFALLLTSVISGLIALSIRSGGLRLRSLVMVCLLVDLGLYFVVAN